MKAILKTLIELVKEMQTNPDCGGDFAGIECEDCKYYYQCLGAVNNRQKCDEMLKALSKIEEVEK